MWDSSAAGPILGRFSTLESKLVKMTVQHTSTPDSLFNSKSNTKAEIEHVEVTAGLPGPGPAPRSHTAGQGLADLMLLDR